MKNLGLTFLPFLTPTNSSKVHPMLPMGGWRGTVGLGAGMALPLAEGNTFLRPFWQPAVITSKPDRYSKMAQDFTLLA